jgi:hypothetical protein
MNLAEASHEGWSTGGDRLAAPATNEAEGYVAEAVRSTAVGRTAASWARFRPAACQGASFTLR